MFLRIVRLSVVPSVLLVVLAGLAACGADAGGGQPAGEPIVIGNVGTTSGPLGARYGVMQRAVQAWAEVVNKNGGIAGRPVRVETGDDANDPARHRGLVQDMVERKGVVVFAGMPATDTQGASVAYLEEKGVPVVGGVIGQPPWGTSPILFPQGFSAANKARALMYAAATSGKTRYAFIGTHTHGHGHAGEAGIEEFAKEFRGGAAEEAGIELVFDDEIPVGASDYSAVCLAAKQAGVELMTILADFPTHAQVVQSCARERFTPTYVTTGTTTSQQLVDLVGGQHMEGAIGLSRTAPWMADRPADLSAWRAAMKGNGVDVNASSLLGWASGRILEEALRRVDGEITPAAVAASLRGLDGENLGGLVAPIDFGSSAGEPNLGSKCFWPLVVRNGAWAPSAAGQVCLR